MNATHSDLNPSFYNHQHGPMNADRAAAILSKYGHRGETKWWVDSRQEYHNGKARVLHVAVGSKSQKLHPFEAIAIATSYMQHPGSGSVGDSEITEIQ